MKTTKPRSRKRAVKTAGTARFVRESLGLTREEFAQAMRCAVASVYRWEESEKDPKGLYGDLLRYMAERLKARPIAADRWGTMLRRAPSTGLWLIMLIMAPPPLRSGRNEEYGQHLAWLTEERSKDVAANSPPLTWMTGEPDEA